MQNIARTEHLASAVKTFHKNDFSSLTQLAEGGEGITYRGRHAYFGDVCAKVFFRGPSQGTNHNEVRLLLKHGHHPNVIQLFGLFEDNDHPFQRAQIGYVMEFMPGGSLSSVIYSNYQYNERHIYNWVSQAAKGLQHLHQAGIIHRDVKPANMLLDESKKKLKISDFGIARANDLHTKTQVGTHIYMAPEMFCSHHQYGLPVDVYALAISFWEMLYRRHPFNGNNYPEKSLRPYVDSTFPPLVQNLLQQCWNHAAYDRPSVMQIITTIDDHMERTKSHERIATVAPENGPYQDVATVSTQRSSGSSGYSSVPQTPATAPVQGHPLSAGNRGPATVPEEKPRKKHKHKKEKRREETYSNDDRDPNLSGANLMMDMLTQAMQNTNLNEQKNRKLLEHKNVDASAGDILTSTLFAQFLRLPCQQFQASRVLMDNYIQACIADLPKQSQCIRIFGMGPTGAFQGMDSVNAFKQLGYQVDNSHCGTYSDYYRSMFFIHFNSQNYEDEQGREKFNRIMQIWETVKRCYELGTVPRTWQSTKLNVLVVGCSTLSGQRFVQQLQLYCQLIDDNIDPLIVYNINLIAADFNDTCMAVQACSLANLIKEKEREGQGICQIIYLVDCDTSYGIFGSDWKLLANSQYSRIMIGCNSTQDYQKCTQDLRNAFTDKDDYHNIIPFLKRQNENQSPTCFGGDCEMYRMFHSVYRQCLMNTVRALPNF